MGKTQDLYIKAKALIPGGTQLLSKRPELFLPGYWPAYYKKAAGCEIWDLDDKHYFDFITMGIGSCILGYADPDVNKAVSDAVTMGSMSSLNSYEEVELAELLCSLHPWADMVRYARSGGEAMMQAVRIGRAATGRDRVLFCGYHGWHDWYISANLADDDQLNGHLLPGLEPNGVPRALKNSSLPFHYNDVAEFKSLISQYDDVGVVVLESIRNDEPDKKFIQTIQQECKARNIVFIVDEITSGWRLNVGGAHLLYDIEPDIAVYAKGMSNGYPMGAILGRKEVMESAQGSFISSTYWTERIGPVAALASVMKMVDHNVPQHLISVGKKLQDNWLKLADKNDLEIHTSGIYPLSHFAFESEYPLVLKTLFTQLMLEKGFLASTGVYSSLAHSDEYIEKYLVAVDETFCVISQALSEGKAEGMLKGEVCHSGFQRLN